MRKLWGRKNSSNVMKVLWLMEELQLAYERIDIGGPFGRTHDADYVAMNPNSVVPTLEEEDGFVLWESNTILRYIASSHAEGTAVWPDDLQARANIDRWMDWQQTTLGPPSTTLFQGLIRTAPEARDATAIEAATARLSQVYALADAQLARHDYLAGANFTLADIPVGVHVHRWFAMPVMRPELPHLRNWYDRLLQRPAYCMHCSASLT